MERVATVERNTRETRITGRVDLDGTGAAEISTGIGFLDHMLEQLARHSLVDVTLHAVGDLGRLDTAFELAVLSFALLLENIQLAKQIERPALLRQ